MRHREYAQPSLNIDEPQPKESTPAKGELFSAILNLQSWILSNLAGKPLRFSPEAVRAKQQELGRKITDKDQALRYLTMPAGTFERYPLFYTALWELIKERRWNIPK